MISPREFKQKWDSEKNGKLINYFAEHLEKLPLSKEDRLFLIEAGLPASAPPYLEFKTVQNLYDQKNNNCKVKEEYLPIGTTGGGDYIYINTNNRNIIYLDSGNQNKEVFINSTINQLAECILLFSNMIDKAIDTNGEDAFLDSDIPPELITWITNEIKRADPKSLEEGAFWHTELKELINE